MVKTMTMIGIALLAGAAYLFTSRTNKSTSGTEEYSSVPASTPSNPYGITASNSVAENLAAANKAIAASYNYKSPTPQTAYAAQVIQAAKSGRAAITTTPTGKEVVVGPTGNVYQQVEGNKYTYSPGPNTAVLGASLVSSSSAAKTAAKAEAAANISKALSGPKVSAKGKYTAVSSKKK